MMVKHVESCPTCGTTLVRDVMPCFRCLSAATPVQYDAYGRMMYHPQMHPKHKTPWTNKDEQYLIENYVIDGPDAVSLALGRTIKTVMGRACDLRKAGKMPDREAGAKFHPRTGSIA